jgi:poly(A) polymerase/tRNA nucleotidyltransferase (CCA-adding enzyme)
MSSRYSVPHEVTHVTDILQKAGFEAYLVGGCVRDLLLGKRPKDWDVTTNATPEEIQSLFEETYYTNTFGTVGVVSHETDDETIKVIEVTPYRVEGTYSDARRPDMVTFGQSLEEDLKRRDFTINALALNVREATLVDLYDGQNDLNRKLIRAVGNPNDRFSEDALRMLRAIRLQAELGFVIEAETYQAIATNVAKLAKISKERIRDELVRILMSDRPMEGLLHMKQLDMLGHVLPDLERSIDVDQNRSHKYTVFEHLLRSLQHAADKGWPLEVRLAALFHDISKPETRRFSREINDHTFYGHEVVGSRVTRKALQDLRFPKEIVEKVVTLVRWHMFFSDPDKISLSAVRRIIRNVGEENIWDLLNVRICDRIGSGRPKEQPFRLRKYTAMVEEALRAPLSVSMLNIDGKRLMEISHETPGPKIGYTLHALLEEVLEDPDKNTAEYLEKRALELLALPVEALKRLGEQGRERRAAEEEGAIKKIHSKYHVN